jgi:bacteriocin-like protein
MQNIELQPVELNDDELNLVSGGLVLNLAVATGNAGANTRTGGVANAGTFGTAATFTNSITVSGFAFGST